MSELGHCLVTGAGGFIGSHLIEELCRRGAHVTALVRYTSRGHRGWLSELDDEYQEQVEVVLGDVRDPDQMRICTQGCDTVFHLAALIGIPYSYASPRQNFETNLLGTLNVLEAARAARVRRVVHTSTSEVYGTAQYVPIDERHPMVGQSPYSASKIAADQLVLSYVRSFELPAVTVRPFNTFGPRQSMRAVIPTIASQALWSDRIRLGALQTTRDFTFVRDTAAGLIQAALASGVEGETFNLGHGQEISIEDLASLIRNLVGRDLPVTPEEERLRPPASEVERLVCDATKARQRLGWEPETSLRDGLQATVDWIATPGPERLTEGYAI